MTGIAQRRVVGSSTRKAVLMFMAGCASDDGTGIWTSKGNMARDMEMSKRTIHAAIADLTEMNVLYECGTRACKNGFTVLYGINIEVLECLDCTRAAAAPVQPLHPTRAAAAPLPVQQLHPNLPLTIHEPSKEPLVVPHEKKPDKARLPENWALSEEGWAYARSQKIPDGVIEDEATGFHAYWSDRTDSSGRKSSRGWEQCWANRCRSIAGRHQPRFGMAFQAASGGRGQGSSIASIVARRRAEGEV